MIGFLTSWFLVGFISFLIVAYIDYNYETSEETYGDYAKGLLMLLVTGWLAPPLMIFYYATQSKWAKTPVKKKKNKE